MKKIKLMLSLIFVIFIFIGCDIDGERYIEINDDNTGKDTLSIGWKLESLKEYDDYYNSNDFNIEDFELYQKFSETYINETDLDYHTIGKKHIGKEFSASFSNIYDYIKNKDKEYDSINIKKLNNGNYQLSVLNKLDSYLLEEVGTLSFETKIKIDLEVIYHNADKVKDNVYTWETGRRIKENNFESIIIEFVPNESNLSNNVYTEAFIDIENHWASDDINSFSDLNLIKGYPDRTFKPDNNITRAEFLSISMNLLGGIENSDDERFWYSKIYDEAIKKDIIRIEEMNIYELDKPITRYEMAMILIRVYRNVHDYDYPEFIVDSGELTDFYEVPEKYKRHVISLYSLNLTNGYPDGEFKGENNGTRAEAVSLISRLIRTIQ